MSQTPVRFLAPLSCFVLTFLPRALAGSIGIYLGFGPWSAAPPARPAGRSTEQPRARSAPQGSRTALFSTQHRG